MNDRSPSLLPAAVRKALPLFAGQGVQFATGYVFAAVLVLLLTAEEMAHFGMLREALRWGSVLGICGIATGVLRLAPERPDEHGDLLLNGCVGVLALSLAVVGCIHLSPGLRSLLVGHPVAEALLLVFAWRIPCGALFRVCISLVHARGALGRKAVLESTERILVTVAAVWGGLAGGLDGLVLGSVVGSVVASLAALVLARPRPAQRSRVRPDLARPLLRIGAPELAAKLLESVRALVVLRLMTERGATIDETGLLAAAMMFTLPLIAAPEAIAQAVYPSMLDPEGEAEDLDRTHTRLLREQALVGIPLLAVFGAFLWWLLPLAKDGAYAGAVAPALALLPGVAAHGLTAHTGYLVLVRNRLKGSAVVSAVTLLVTVALAWFAIPRWGTVGAAASLSLALLLRGVLLVAVARRPAR